MGIISHLEVVGSMYLNLKPKPTDTFVCLAHRGEPPGLPVKAFFLRMEKGPPKQRNYSDGRGDPN